MADAPIAPTPTQTPAPAPAPSGEISGIKSMMDKFDAGVAKIESGKPDAAPEPPKADVAPKVEQAPVVATPEPAKPTAAPEPEVEPAWDKAPKNLRNAHFKFKRDSEEKVAAAQKRIAELESKPTQSPDDLKKIQANEARIAELEKGIEEREKYLAQADYSKSDEFKKKFVEPGNKAYQNAVTAVKNLKIKVADKDGNEMERAATEADFNALRKLEPFEQDQKINELFGTSASRVLWHLNNLERLEGEANEAIATAKEKSAESQKAWHKQQEEINGEFKTHSERAMDELVKNHSVYFAPDAANPEATAALENGFKYVDDAAKNAANLTPKERAETTALIRGLAAAAPRLMVEKKQLLAKLSGLETELAKYRKSSPGNASPTPSAPVATPSASEGGLKGMSKAFDKIPR